MWWIFCGSIFFAGVEIISSLARVPLSSMEWSKGSDKGYRRNRMADIEWREAMEWNEEISTPLVLT